MTFFDVKIFSLKRLAGSHVLVSQSTAFYVETFFDGFIFDFSVVLEQSGGKHKKPKTENGNSSLEVQTCVFAKLHADFPPTTFSSTVVCKSSMNNVLIGSIVALKTCYLEKPLRTIGMDCGIIQNRV